MRESSPQLLDRLSALPGEILVAFKPRRFRRALATAAKVAAIGTVFFASTTAGVLLHLNTTQGRSVGRNIANVVLRPVFQGRIEVGEIEELGLEHAKIKSARIYDPDGVEIIHAEGIEAEVGTLALLRALFLEDGPVVLHFPLAKIDKAVVHLRPDAEGIPTIAHAFIPRDQGPSKPGGRATIVDLPNIIITSADVRSDLGAAFQAHLHDLTGSVTVRDDRLLAVDVPQTGIQLHELLPAEVAGDVSYHLRVDLRRDEVRREAGEEHVEEIMMWADLEGSVGGVPAIASGVMEGVHLDTKVHFERIEPESFKAIFPGLPIEDPVEGRVTVAGKLPKALRIDGVVDIFAEQEKTTLMVDGGVGVDDGVRLTLGVHGIDVDPRSFRPELPRAQIDASAKILVAVPEGASEAQLTADITTLPTTIEGQGIPAVDAVLHLRDGEITISSTLHEPGIPVDAQVTIFDGAVAFSADLDAENLAEDPRLGKRVQGALRARVDGSFADGELDAKVTATGMGVGTIGPGGHADYATLTATVKGPITGLEIDGHASASGVEAQGEKLDTVRVGVKGSVLSPDVTLHVEDGERGTIDAGANVSLLAQAARNITFSIEREGETAKGRIAEIDVSDGFALKGLTIKEGSIGNVTGSLNIDGGELVGDLRAENLDLARLQRLLSLPIPMAGVANVAVDVQRSPGGRRGSIDVELVRGRFLFVNGVSARVSARFEGDDVEASGYVRLVDELLPVKAALGAAGAAAAPAGGNAGRRPKPEPPVAKEEDDGLVCDGPIAEVRFANVKGQLHGPLLSLATWKNATGSADIAADNVNLGCIERRVPAFAWPFEKARGLLMARMRLTRKEDEPRPTIEDLIASSVGLVLVGKDDAWTSDRLDVAFRGSFDGRTGKTSANAATYEHGTTDVLAWLGVVLDLNVDAWLEGGEKGARALREAPIALTLQVPKRSVEGFNVLPKPISGSIPQMDGTVGALVELTGTLDRPTVTLDVEALGLLPAGVASGGVWIPSVDLAIDGTYDPNRPKEQGHIDIVATADKTEIAKAALDVTLPATALFGRPKGTPLPWTGNLTAELKGVPFETIPTLADRGLQGSLSGRLALNGLNEAPWGSMDLTSSRLRIQGQPLKMKVDASIDETGAASFTAAVFDDPRQAATGGPNDPAGETTADIRERLGEPTLLATARAALPWVGKIVPMFDPTKPGELAVDADGFRLSGLFPLVAGTVSKLDGLLTGKATLRWDDLSNPLSARVELLEKVCAVRDTRGNILVSEEPVDGKCGVGRVLVDAPGKLYLSDVVAYIPPIGQELHDGRATIIAQPGPDGTQQLVLENFEVQGSSGRFIGGADAPNITPPAGQLPNWQPHVNLKGLSFVSAKGTIVIPVGEEIPVTVEGVSFGKARGRIDFDMEPTETAVVSNIRVHEANFELPASSSRNVQSIESARGVQVNALLGPPEEIRSGQATRYEFNVAVNPTKVTSNALAVTLKSDGPVKLVLADRLYASGDVQLIKGTVVVNKKKFEIDRGLIRLRNEEAGNPYVNLTAHWDAGSDLRVFVDYVGLLSPITDDKIRFRADPPLPQDEIVQMLLFGQGANASATNLVGTVGGTVATGFANDLLAAATGSFFRDVTVSIGTSETESSVGAAWQGSDRVTVGAGFRQLEESTERTSTERCGDLYLEWRVSDRWFLRGTSGYCGEEDASSESGVEDGISIGIDALWQYRY